MNNETIIIGGGPAGSAAAILLAKQGMPVRLLERQTGPHHKVCGEFISYEAAHYLQALGVDLPALGAEPIRQVRFYNGEQQLAFRLPFTAWSLSRRVLDAALLKQAEMAGVVVELGAAVTQLSRTGSGWELIRRSQSTSTDDGSVLSAKTIFLATGKHELRGWPRQVDRNVNAKVAINTRADLKNTGMGHNQFIGFKMHFRSDSSLQDQWQKAVEIHLFDDGYAGLEPIEQGGVNLCFLIGQNTYKTCGSNWPAVLDWLGRRSSHLQQSLANLTPCWSEPLAVAGIPYGYINPPNNAQPGLFRLGDQAAVIPSFAGDGIAIALHTAALAAQIHRAGGDSSLYQYQACEALTPPVRNAKRLADILASSVGRNTAFRLGLLLPSLLRKKLLQELFLRTRVFSPIPLNFA
ncbi:MAG: FAD-dependent monooxygenase [Cellvibrio sp.]|uniref:NAD(P)/FAD-dependent oxidoreductase n=1 Tax=Cellvibrio sp. TaxID=1965322 RepID=UPI00272557A2|nr:FAD-dependent monooxygenase [Cellvibrio sp.]